MSNRVKLPGGACDNKSCDVCWCDERPETDFDTGLDEVVVQADFEIALSKVFQEAEQLLIRKHNDYGPRNIGDAPGGPLNGLLVRMWDKMARLRNLVEKDVEPSNESVRDSYLDLMNYAAIALMVIDDTWPKE